MTIETIDNVQYYVWRAGDELPSYQPIDAKIIGGQFDGKFVGASPKYWADTFKHISWPKLLNDRAQHQRMIDEAFETALDHDHYAFIHHHNKLAFVHAQSGNKLYALDHLAKAGAYVKRMMEYVQAQIDKEGEKI